MLNLKIGDRVKIDTKCYKPYYVSQYGTIVGISASGWSDTGGIYKLKMDDGKQFHCSEESIVEVIGGRS